MKIEFDSEADALYVEFHDGQVYDCLAVTEGVNVDIDEDGNPLGIEILDVSKRFSINDLCNLTIQNMPINGGASRPMEEMGLPVPEANPGSAILILWVIQLSEEGKQNERTSKN